MGRWWLRGASSWSFGASGYVVMRCWCWFCACFWVFVGVCAEFAFDFDGGDEVGGLGGAEVVLGEVRGQVVGLVKWEKEEAGKKAPKPFKKFLKLLKRALSEAEDEENPSLKKLKTTVDTLMAKVDEAYVEGEKSLARIIVQRNQILADHVLLILQTMATTQKHLLDLSTNIVVRIAHKSLLN